MPSSPLPDPRQLTLGSVINRYCGLRRWGAPIGTNGIAVSSETDHLLRRRARRTSTCSAQPRPAVLVRGAALSSLEFHLPVCVLAPPNLLTPENAARLCRRAAS